MGITNFCKLLNCIKEPSPAPDEYDSVLIDTQGFLYCAIELSLETDEQKLFQEVCHFTWIQLVRTLGRIFTSRPVQNVTLIVSLDGEGVPMKWPTQRSRRNRLKFSNNKTLYSCSLFGHNSISAFVKRYLMDRFKSTDSFQLQDMRVVFSGSNVPGEGEHKIFHIAEALNCKRPVVVSVDQDVFVLAISRLDRYDSIQVFRYEQFYNVTKLAQEHLPYPVDHLKVISFLFGNDFCPVVVGISPANAAKIHFCISQLQEDAEEQEEKSEEYASLVSRFLKSMEHQIRFTETPHVDYELVVAFWLTFLWVLDYYTQRDFPQKHMLNKVFDAFHRNQLLTALVDPEYSSKALREARSRYETTVTRPFQRDLVERSVFTDENVLARLRSYWGAPAEEDACEIIRVTREPQS